MTLGQYALLALALACIVLAALPYYLIIKGEGGDNG